MGYGNNKVHHPKHNVPIIALFYLDAHIADTCGIDKIYWNIMKKCVYELCVNGGMAKKTCKYSICFHFAFVV
jgi:hypothetical protein